MSKILPTSGFKFKWIDLERFGFNKYTSSTSNSWKGPVLQVDYEYLKELRELHNDYPLASIKNRNQKRNAIWVSTEDCWFILIADCWLLINIGNIKKLVPSFLDKEKYVLHYENL